MPKSPQSTPLSPNESLSETEFDPEAILIFETFEDYVEAPKAKKSNPLAEKTFRLISNLFFALICIVLVVGSILFAFSNNPEKSYFGFRIYNVLTKSMTPKEDGSSPPGGFEQGALIIVKICKAQDIEVGDIITFNPGTHDETGTNFLTHRVIEVNNYLNGKQGTFFVTQGDVNNTPDPPISEDMMIGKKVFHISHAGNVLQWIRTNFVLSMIILVSFFMSVFFFRWYFAKPEKKTKKAV